MRWTLVLFLVTLPGSLLAQEKYSPVLAIHGGVGVLPRGKMTPALEKLYRQDLERALKAGHAELMRKGGTSTDAVVAAIKVLEDSPRFNAGKGAVFTHDGRNELDASLMEGKEKRAGAVAAVSIVKNPIEAARAVMEHSPHVLLVGKGAEDFAREQRLTVVKPDYFHTPERWQQLQDALKEEKSGKPMGTVGAVALDAFGNLAAGTSTGGMTNKRFGRVGDSPIIGAGTYADNASCAVSCTGHGEIFIRHAAAHSVAARVRFARESLQKAADAVLAEMPKEEGGVGGLIALNVRGQVVFSYNTEGMYRGVISADGQVQVFIYGR